MRRLSMSHVLGILGSAVLLTGACGGSSFTADGGAGKGNAGASAAGTGNQSGSAGSGGSSMGGGTSGGSSMGGATSGGSSMGGAMSGGASGNAGSSGTTCANGSVTFRLVPGQGTAPGAFCSGCGVTWLTVTNSNAKVVPMDRSCAVASCDSCMASGCPPIACLNQAVPAEGLSRDWNETQWLSSTCGPDALACAAPHCVPPGKYKAKMCALKNSTPTSMICTPENNGTVCTEVDFELPGASMVVGTLGG